MNASITNSSDVETDGAIIIDDYGTNLNRKQALEFFKALYPYPLEGFAAVFFSKADNKNHPLPFENHEALVDKAMELDAKGESWFCVCLHGLSVIDDRSRKAITAKVFPGLWLDFDTQSPFHKKSNLPLSKEEVLEFLAKLGVKVSLVIESGNGLHVYILLKTPFVITTPEDYERIEKLTKAFSGYVLSEAKKEGWDLDNVSDLARILRVPGTFNHKDPENLKPVTLLHLDDSCRYELEDLEHWVLSAAEAVVQSSAKAVKIDKIPEGSRNTTLTREAGRLNRNGLNRDEILAELVKINVERCEPELDEDEVGRIAHSVSKYPNGKTLNSGSFELTDLGNAKRFVHQHGDTVKYCGKWNKWVVWDGKHWEKDDTGQVARLAKQTILSIYKEASTCQDDQLRPLILAHAKKSQSASQIKALLEVAKTEREVAVRPGDFDKDIYLFNCESGTLNLLTGTLMEHDPKDLITKLSPVAYAPEAECPVFLSFLDRIFGGDEEIIGYLQKVMGYTLSGDISEQVFLYFYGLGANGKSVFLEIFRKILGDYGKQSELTTFLTRKNDSVRNDLAALSGSRFVTATEVDSDRTLCESVIKQVTGGEPLSVRFLYGEQFEFTPNFKLFIAANHKLVTQNQDHGLWRRLKMIPFDVTIPEKERDNQLLEKLKGEMSGIFNWALEGFRLWKLNRLTTPRAVEEATGKYKSEMDTVGDFIDSRCVVADEESERIHALYEAYVEWCKNNKESYLGKIQFSDRISQKGFKKGRNGKVRCWLGISLNSINAMM